MTGWELDGDVARLSYPERPLSEILRVELEDVRASKGFSIQYDMERDGWIISVPTKFQWFAGEVPDEQLREVAFVPSWDGTEDIP